MMMMIRISMINLDIITYYSQWGVWQGGRSCADSVRQKVWTQSPNICYSVTIQDLRRLRALWKALGKQSVFWGQISLKTMFYIQEMHHNMIHIVCNSEMNYTQKWHICREFAKTRPTKELEACQLACDKTRIYKVPPKPKQLCAIRHQLWKILTLCGRSWITKIYNHQEKCLAVVEILRWFILGGSSSKMSKHFITTLKVPSHNLFSIGVGNAWIFTLWIHCISYFRTGNWAFTVSMFAIFFKNCLWLLYLTVCRMIHCAL